MEIYPLGHASFKLKGKSATVVTDPYDPVMVGLKFPRHTSAEIITISHNHKDHSYLRELEIDKANPPVIFNGPGEYEARGVDILGIATWHDSKNGVERGSNTIYRIDVDGVSILHCGDLGHKLSEEQKDQIGEVDVLLIPVGGFYTIDASTAADISAELEPAIIIPMHYKRPGMSKDFDSLTGVDVFLKEMGKEGVSPQPKLKVTRDNLPQETQVVVLE